jgi:magnesium chelatase family protein
MTVAITHTVSLQGTTGHLIDVQADVSIGQVALNLVGRPDASLNEAKERCRMAVVNSGVAWPSSKRITILLSPSDLMKRGTHFDLAIAVAVVAATDEEPLRGLRGTLMIGELTLTGGLRSVPGVLPMVLAAQARGIRRVFVPEPQASEAAMVPGVEVVGFRSLAQVLAELAGREVPVAPPVAPMSGQRLLSWRGQDRQEETDLADLVGMQDARYAVEVAAAGGHHLMLSGPKGSGKTSLAERISGILPDLGAEETLELTALHSLAGALEPGDEPITRPPYSAPHHSTSKAALLGGGSGRVRPGELSRAHCGVLFLDEFPLLPADVIEALRQPLESGEVTIARGEETATFPARAMVVLAANPCPCGDFHLVQRLNRCTCRETTRRDYRRKLTGPMLDRVDITRHVEPLAKHEARDRLAVHESTAVVRARVSAARARQAERYADRGWRVNAQVPGPQLVTEWRMTDAATRVLEDELYAGRVTFRGVVRIHRLAWTVADLRGQDRPGVEELAVAQRLRNGDPMLAQMLERAG